MSARENIAAHFTSDVLADELLDAYRTEVLAEAKAETVAWLVKKVREYRATGSSQHRLQADAIATLASKIDRGAVRAFIGTKHYRDAMDAHRVEVLREAADFLAEIGTPIHGERTEHERGLMYGAERLRRLAAEGGA